MLGRGHQSPLRTLPGLADCLRFVDRVLTGVAIALMLAGAYYPIFDVLPGQGAQRLALIVTATAIAGGFLTPRGSRLGLTLQWAAFGMAVAVGTIGIFSVGFVYLIAGVLLLLAIFATPNRSEIELRYDWRYIAGCYAGYLLIFSFFLFRR